MLHLSDLAALDETGDLSGQLVSIQQRALLREQLRAESWIGILTAAGLALIIAGGFRLADSLGFTIRLTAQGFDQWRAAALFLVALASLWFIHNAWRARAQLLRSKIYLFELAENRTV
jgi:hypothetical protein